MDGCKKHWLVTHVVTESCNLNCRMCFQSKIRKKKNPELTLSQIEDFYRKHYQNMSAVNITGGEPFVRPDCIELIEMLDQLGLPITVNTNGTLITPVIAGRLANLSHLRSITISIDGPRTIHDAIRNKSGSYDKTMENIALLAEKTDIRIIGITTMLMPELLKNLEEHISYLEAQGIRKLSLNFPGSYSQAEIDKSVACLKQHGLTGVIIDTAGEEIFRQLSVENAEMIAAVITRHPQMKIGVNPKSFITNPSLFLDGKLDDYTIGCSKLKRNEIRINSAGQIVFCDTLRIPFGDIMAVDNLESIFTQQSFINLRAAIADGLPCCKRCCKSTNLTGRRQVTEEVGSEAI